MKVSTVEPLISDPRWDRPEVCTCRKKKSRIVRGGRKLLLKLVQNNISIKLISDCVKHRLPRSQSKTAGLDMRQMLNYMLRKPQIWSPHLPRLRSICRVAGRDALSSNIT